MIVFLYTVILIRFRAELLIVISDRAYHGAFEIKMNLLLTRQFDRF